MLIISAPSFEQGNESCRLFNCFNCSIRIATSPLVILCFPEKGTPPTGTST